MVTFDSVLEKAVKKNSDLQKDRLKSAYEYAEKLHDNQYRLSGDAFIVHLLSVVDILLQLRPDEDTIIAAMLHGVFSSPYYNEKEIIDKFGENVARMVNDVESLRNINLDNRSADVESIRKMFLTMAKDVRVVLIKFADRLDNMNTLSFRSSAEQKQVSRETLDVYIPIAARLGIYTYKVQLEDRIFKYLYPNEYKHLKSELNEYISNRHGTIEDIKKELRSLLDKHEIEAVIEGRIKNLYSIYRKLKLKSYSRIDDLHDVYAIRVILPTEYTTRKVATNVSLYDVLGLIHRAWEPLAHRFKDYVAVPKSNGYKSLHTSVKGMSPKSNEQLTEIQIRSQLMHEEAEFGSASHWIYDRDKKHKSSTNKASGTNNDWIKSLSSFQKDVKDGNDLNELLKTDVFSDRIFVMTPKGEVKDLVKGSTPIDFAYAVHTDIGHRCILAKVGDSVVPLDYHLKNGEVVEILIGKNKNPKSSWLSFVKTNLARNQIRAFFRSLDKEKSFRDGRDIVNKYLVKMGEPILDENLTIFREYNRKRLSLKDRGGIIEEVGNGSVLALSVLKKVFGSKFSSLARDSKQVKTQRVKFVLPKSKSGTNKGSSRICISGECDLPYKIANCCKPKSGESIVGYITSSHLVTIHQSKCKRIQNVLDADRILEATWGGSKIKNKYSIKLSFVAKRRSGLIGEVLKVIEDLNATIVFLNDGSEKNNNNGIIKREVIVKVDNNSQLEQLFERLERVRDVLEVNKVD